MSAVVLKLNLSSAEHQLVRIPLERIPDCWEYIASFIQDALTEDVDEENIVMIYSNLVSGILEAWVLVRKGDEEDWSDGQTAAVITLQINENINTGTRSLFLYTMSGAEYLSDEVWADMAVAAAEYARKSNCTTVTAVSSNARVIQVFEKAGANTEARYMTLVVGG